jgi:hypothetical protein
MQRLICKEFHIILYAAPLLLGVMEAVRLPLSGAGNSRYGISIKLISFCAPSPWNASLLINTQNFSREREGDILLENGVSRHVDLAIHFISALHSHAHSSTAPLALSKCGYWYFSDTLTRQAHLYCWNFTPRNICALLATRNSLGST